MIYFDMHLIVFLYFSLGVINLIYIGDDVLKTIKDDDNNTNDYFFAVFVFLCFCIFCWPILFWDKLRGD